MIVSTVLVVGAAAVMGTWWALSTERRSVSYRVIGTLSAIELDLDSASVEVVGGEDGPVRVERTEEFAFGEPPRDEHAVRDGVLRITSRCPETIVGTCSAAYRIAVRDNVDLDIRSSSGGVRVLGLNGSARIRTGSAPIAVDGFCGFTLTATSASGDVQGSADCSPDSMELRSASGDVHAIVPAGRYRVDANSDRGTTDVRNMTPSDDASFAIQAISGSGDVVVESSR